MIGMANRRNTVQRQIVLETLKKLDTHPTAVDVYSEIHKTHPTIGQATVYRNLRQLAEGGEIGALMLPDDLGRFDGRVDRHYHFKCKNCGRIFDVDIDYLTGINETVQQKYGFQVDEHDVVFRGICPECRGAMIE